MILYVNLERNSQAEVGQAQGVQNWFHSVPFVKVKEENLIMRDSFYRENEENDASQLAVKTIKAFEIMETEVTQKQWFQVMGDNPSYFKREGDCDNWDSRNKMCPDHPVEQVSWYDVQKFIKELNAFLGLRNCNGTPSFSRGCYRLPTEEEWEMAVRAGTKTAYFFEGDVSVLEDYSWHYANSMGRTHKVRTRKPNPLGLYDMYGNVWEWVQDTYKREWPGDNNPSVTVGYFHVVRGGGWSYSMKSINSTLRGWAYVGDQRKTIGFRLVRTL